MKLVEIIPKQAIVADLLAEDRDSAIVELLEALERAGRVRPEHREDIILGRDLVAEPSSDVLNNVSFYAGFSILF